MSLISLFHSAFLWLQLHEATNTVMRVQLGNFLRNSLDLLIERLTDPDDSKRPVFVIALTLHDG